MEVPQQAIVAVGDSVAYGAYDTVRGGWVTRLGRILVATYPHAHIRLVNAAGNGGNSGLLVTVLHHVRQHATPVLILIAYGLNDFDERVPAKTLAAHLRAAVRLLRSCVTFKNSRPFFLTDQWPSADCAASGSASVIDRQSS